MAGAPVNKPLPMLKQATPGGVSDTTQRHESMRGTSWKEGRGDEWEMGVEMTKIHYVHV